MSDNRVVLSVREVTKQFGGLVAVDNVTLSVAEHEVVGIIKINLSPFSISFQKGPILDHLLV